MLPVLRRINGRLFCSNVRSLSFTAPGRQVDRSYLRLDTLDIMGKRGYDKPAGGNFKRQKRAAAPARFEGSHEEVLLQDIKHLLSSRKPIEDGSEAAAANASTEMPEKFSEVEVRISEISSTGDSIGFTDLKDHAFVVPFALPGELIKAKVVRTDTSNKYSVTDFLEVLEPSSRRDPSLVKCGYFAKCSGCQLQMIPYEDQLKHKRTIIEKAYRNFSGLPAENVPVVGETIGSPLQYSYRTKLTPHFDRPPGVPMRSKQPFKELPAFGFMQKNTRWTMDIEDCPIGTDAVREGLKKERERLSKDFSDYHRGATILLRESTERRHAQDEGDKSAETFYEDVKTCITDQNATSTEYVGSYIFTNPAGSFFQNNNSILPVFTEYIKEQIIAFKEETIDGVKMKPLDYLIDAYCGSGLFTVTLSSLFQSSMGIDIAEASIAYATKNAKLNKVDNTKFIAATASRLFDSVTFDSDATMVVIDPPRKGCDNEFLEQLLRFGPRKVAYVSCNVHTQARDIGIMVQGLEGIATKYKLDSLRGFDFFPQTGHVESVAFLSRQT